MKLLAVLLSIGFLFPCALAAAPATATKIVFKKSETHRFTGAKLEGKLKKPELSYIYERKSLREEQIVNIPDNFDDEIVAGESQL